MINKLVTRLAAEGIRFGLKRGELVYQSKSALSAMQLEEIKLHKEEIIDLLQRKRRSRSAASESAIELRRYDQAYYPLSFGQEQMWFVDQFMDGGSQFNMPVALRLEGGLDVYALELAIRELVERHHALRCVISEVDGKAQQQVKSSVDFSLAKAKCNYSQREQQDRAVDDWVQKQLSMPFDLRCDYMLRAALLEYGEGEHILVLVLHHIAGDGISINLLLSELRQLYQANLQGGQNPLPPLALQYTDYVCFQQEVAAKAGYQKQIDYWLDYLKNCPSTHSLPITQQDPRRRQKSEKAFWLEPLDSSLLESLTAFHRSSGTTLFVLLRTAFALLISRYSSESDIVLGTPMSNRNDQRLESVVGLFANLVVSRTQINDSETFEELLKRSQKQAVSDFQYQDIPFDLLVERLNPERHSERNPLAQLAFSLSDYDTEQLLLPGVTVTPVGHDYLVGNFDLHVDVRTNGQGGTISWTYSTSLFDAGLIKRMASNFMVLLQSLITDPLSKVATLPILAREESLKLIEKHNQSGRAYCKETGLIELFEQQVATRPNSAALIEGDHSVSFERLNQKAELLGRWLRHKGVVAGTRVGICIERSIDSVIALLGVLKAGGCYVPMEPQHPDERLRYIASDAGVSIVLTHQQYVERLSQYTSEQLSLDQEWSIPGDIEFNGEQERRSETPTYVIYTSGSTGRPKGVVGGQSGVLNRLHWMWHRYPYVAGELGCHKTALSFVDHVWEVFGPLLQGVPVLLLADEQVKQPEVLVDELASHGVTRLVLVPSLLEAILALPQQQITKLSSLKWWTSSGEVLGADLATAFCQQLPTATLLNLYGSSEVTADATYYEVNADSLPLYVQGVPIGRPIANTQVYLLDEQGGLVPDGCVGEVCIAGDGVALGYTNPELGNGRFLANPFGEGRLYRSGDLAYWNQQNELIYQGRNDHQIKLRGHRIELGEINQALLSLDAVRQATVIDWHHNDQVLLVAYVAFEEGHELLAKELKSALTGFLPSYMVPSLYEFLDKLPLNVNGKLDRNALPEPSFSQPEREETRPLTETEVRLGQIWQHLLNVEVTSNQAHFFDMGGHSLLLAQLLGLVRAEFQNELGFKALFNHPVLHEQAALIDRQSLYLQMNTDMEAEDEMDSEEIEL